MNVLKNLITGCVMLCIWMTVAVALAQDQIPPGESPMGLEAIVVALISLFIVPAAAPIVTLIVNGLKLLIPLPASLLALIVQVIVWVIWYASNYLGYGDVFNAIVPQLAELLRIILSIGGVVVGVPLSAAVHKWAAQSEIPVVRPLLGYSRT